MFDHDMGESPEIDAFIEEAYTWWEKHIWLHGEVKRQIEAQCIDFDRLQGLENPLIITALASLKSKFVMQKKMHAVIEAKVENIEETI